MTKPATVHEMVRRSLGRILNVRGEPVGTCFQIAPGYLVTAHHVITQAGDGHARAAIHVEPISVGERTASNLDEALDEVQGESMVSARVMVADERCDLTLLRTDHPLPGCISHLSLSEPQHSSTSIQLSGYGTTAEASGTRRYWYLETTGVWEGVVEEQGQPVRGIAQADGVAQGMSGCPVVRSTDGAVIGVLSHRYRSEDGWSDRRAWIGRTEDLVRLLDSVVTEGAMSTGVSEAAAAPMTVLAQVPVEQGPAPIRLSPSTLLAETPLDRDRLRGDPCFVQPESWAQPWAQAVEAIEAGEVLVVSGLPGVGSTTFAEQLLARHSHSRMRLIRLDPGDWDTPSANLLPRQPWSAYVLDLRDPDNDRPSEEFLHDLTVLGRWYQDMKIRLVVTIADDLWHGKGGKQRPFVRAVTLSRAPNPYDLVQRHISERAPHLVPIVDSPEVAAHLDGSPGTRSGVSGAQRGSERPGQSSRTCRSIAA